MASLKRNLKIVWDEGGATKRYRPKSLDGGSGWGVWDAKAGKFLKDREVAAMSGEQLRETFAN